jgi:hypothetical protein
VAPRIDDEIAQLRQEIAALEARRKADQPMSPEEEAKWLEVAGYMVDGQEIPEELLDDLDAREVMRDFLPVLQEMLEEGCFDAPDEDGYEDEGSPLAGP